MIRTIRASSIAVFIAIQSAVALAQAPIESAETSFKYLANTLQTFRNTGRLVNNPGIDGADLEAYMEFLDYFYGEFSRGFNRDSAMCEFYLDPENGRMTIAERAELSFSFLRDLEGRVAHYVTVDREFQDTIENEFGSFLLRNLNQRKITVVSDQRLPASPFDEAAVIGFLDTMCT